MDREKLASQLIIDEGEVLHIYRDSLGFFTAGVGHLLPNSTRWQRVGKMITRAQSREWLDSDISCAIVACCNIFPGFVTYPEEAQQILANMAFNLGQAKLSQFRHMILACTNHDWLSAADSMIDSAWYAQVGDRGKRLVARMRAIA